MGQSLSNPPTLSRISEERDSHPTQGNEPGLENVEQPSPDPQPGSKQQPKQQTVLGFEYESPPTYVFGDDLPHDSSGLAPTLKNDSDLRIEAPSTPHPSDLPTSKSATEEKIVSAPRAPATAGGSAAEEQPLNLLFDAVDSHRPGRQPTETTPSAADGEAAAVTLALRDSPGDQNISSRKTKAKADSQSNRSRPRLRHGPSNGIGFSFSSLFENARALGLDIGSGSTKYVHLARAARGVRLIGSGNICLAKGRNETETEGTQSDFVKLLREKFKSKSFKNTLITTAISGMEVVFKNIRVPPMARKELAKAVPWACRKDLPFPVESTTFEFVNLSDRKQVHDQLELFVVAARKEVLDGHLDILSQTDIQPAKVSTIPYALWNVFQHCVGKYAEGCQALVDIGAKSSHIIIVNDGHLQFAREISTAGLDVTESLMCPLFVEGREIRLSAKRAEALKRRHGIPRREELEETSDGVPLQDISVLMVPVLERLVSDIQRTLDFAKEKFQVDTIRRVYLTGGGALMPNLTDFMQHELNLDVLLLNPFDTISHGKVSRQDELYKIGPRFAVATGLALDRSKNLNMLPEALRGSHALQYARRLYKYIFVLAVSAMVFLSQDVTREVSNLAREFKQLNAEYQASEPVRKTFQTAQATYRQMQALEKQYDSAINMHLDAATHLRVISHYMPRNLTLTSLRIVRRIGKQTDEADNPLPQKEFLILDGVAFEDHSLEGLNLANFLLQLEASRYFKSLSLDKQKILEDGGLQFTIECETALEQP